MESDLIPDDLWFEIGRHADPVTKAIMRMACKPFSQWPRKRYTDRLITMLCFEGDLKLLKWLCSVLKIHNMKGVTSQHPYISLCCANAIRGNNLEILKWLHSKHFPLPMAFANKAAENGNYEIFIFLKSVLGENLTSYISFDSAAIGGNVEILKSLNLNRNPSPKDDKIIYMKAAVNGNFEALDWLKENEFDYSKKIILRIARKGDFDIVKFLVEKHKCPIHPKSCDQAIASGNLELTKWLIEKDCYPTHDAYGLAVINNNLHMLKWLKENGYQTNSNYLPFSSNIKIVEWIEENGYTMYSDDW